MVRKRLKYAKWLLIALVAWWIFSPAEEDTSVPPPMRKPPIVMLGDSLIFYGSWQQAFPDRPVLNKGVTGDTVQGVINRLPRIIALKPSRVFLMIGINDLLGDVKGETLFNSYHVIIDQITAAGIPLVVQSTLYCNTTTFYGCKQINIEVDNLNAKLKQYAGAKNNVEYVDVNKVLSRYKTLRDLLTNDGIHPNRRGYQMWYEAIYPYVAGEKSIR